MDTATKKRHQTENNRDLEGVRNRLSNGVIPNALAALKDFDTIQADYEEGGKWHPDSAEDADERALFEEFTQDAVGPGGLLSIMDAEIPIPEASMTFPDLLAFVVNAAYGIDEQSGGLLGLPELSEEDQAIIAAELVT